MIFTIALMIDKKFVTLSSIYKFSCKSFVQKKDQRGSAKVTEGKFNIMIRISHGILHSEHERRELNSVKIPVCLTEDSNTFLQIFAFVCLLNLLRVLI